MKTTVLFTVLLLVLQTCSVSAFVEELDDTRLDPVWHAIGSELRSQGSLVSVGKADATAPHQGNYTAVATELIVHTYFFSASRDVLPKDVSIPKLPAVVVFKEEKFLTYNEESDGELMAWVSRERFRRYSKLDSFTLYSMGDTGKMVAMALLDDITSVEKGRRDFYFGYMEGDEYVRGLVMGEVQMPSIIVLNLSNDGYFLPPIVMETEEHLLEFLNGVLDKSVEVRDDEGPLLCLMKWR
ncbi:hypothetical protein CRUP_029098 [Coryphaenoides rupestris]|nr:hypothetical protein CRUP_029098 [Coryphaenoides rupestris]